MDLEDWIPQENIAYKGYSRYSRRGYHSGRVLIHINNNQYVGGFFISGLKVMVWYNNENHIKKEVSVPTASCSFTKRREGNTNIYEVVINDTGTVSQIETDQENDETNTANGNIMANNEKTPIKIPQFKENIGWWDRLLKRTDAIYWKGRIQTELDTRWTTFDTTIQKLTTDFKKFNRQAMEIMEEENNMKTYKDEWEESLTSLGNLLNKNTGHEKQMWDTTQRNKNMKGLKIKQKFKDSDVDEIRFNNMMEYIKQYPELQSQRTIEKLIENVKEKRIDILSVSKVYGQAKKEANDYLNIAKINLQEVEDQLASFEKMKKEGEQKVNDAQDKGLKNKLLNWNKTEAEKQSTKLDMFKYDRKIDGSKNQLKLIKQRINEYEEREFKPIVTRKFQDIEE